MTIEVVDGALAALRKEPTAFAHEARLATAVGRGMGDVFVVEASPIITIATKHGRARPCA